MTTRDGKRLLADIYRPTGIESAPVLLRRTPYGNRNNDLAETFTEADFYASHGYLTVVQNTRGRFGSEGVWYPFVYEANDGFDAIEVCTGYMLDGKEIDHLPAGEGAQARVVPVYETIEGWKEPTANARSWADLPAQAIKYVRRVEELVGCPIALLSTSPEREDTILVQNPFEA